VENKRTAAYDDFDKYLLYALKTSCVLLWTTKQYGIGIIETR